MKRKKARFTSDFETVTWLENETYVWCWAVCNIDTMATEWGTDMESFFNWCECQDNPTLYFHNLKFDGEFIIHYLLTHDYEYYSDKYINGKMFTTLISDMGQFFSIKVNFAKNKSVTFLDSLKVIPSRVEDIPRTFGLDIKKLDLDYNKPRERGYIPSNDELQYILNDVKIPAMALKIMFEQGLNKITQASNAMADFKNTIGFKTFKHFFPELPLAIDEDIRTSYRGGFTYLNPIYKDKEVGAGVVLDVNSLYPSVMLNERLPISYPIFFKGKYKENAIYDLYIQRFSCCFELKEGKIPTIQIKGRKDFNPCEYLTSSNGHIVILTLTNIDLQLFFENYEVKQLEYLSGWQFRSAKGIFSKYIDKWSKIKIDSGKNGNKGMRTIAKLMQNALYGKFGLNPKCRKKTPFLHDDIVKYHTEPEEIRDPIFIPMASFITAYARDKTIRTSQTIRDYSVEHYGQDMYIYSDTDSIHTLLPESELQSICDIDDYRYGAWKIENTFTKGKFLRQKSYIEQDGDKIKITCAGLPDKCYKQVSFNNFKIGSEYKGKLSYSHVKGGVKLVETTFKIREKIFDKF